MAAVITGNSVETRARTLLRELDEGAKTEGCIRSEMRVVNQKLEDIFAQLRKGLVIDELESTCYLAGLRAHKKRKLEGKALRSELHWGDPLRREISEAIKRTDANFKQNGKILKSSINKQQTELDIIDMQYKQTEHFPLDRLTRRILTYGGGVLMAFSVVLDSLSITDLPLPDNIRNAIGEIGLVAFVIGSSGRIIKYLVSVPTDIEQVIEKYHENLKKRHAQNGKPAVEKKEMEEIAVSASITVETR